MVTRKSHLLFSHHLNRDAEARFMNSTFFEERSGVLPSANFAISISLRITNKSTKNK